MTAHPSPLPSCSDLGKLHVYRGGNACLICGTRRRRNEIGQACFKCGVTLGEKNSREVGDELRCLGCKATRDAARRRR